MTECVIISHAKSNVCYLHKNQIRHIAPSGEANNASQCIWLIGAKWPHHSDPLVGIFTRFHFSERLRNV